MDDGRWTMDEGRRAKDEGRRTMDDGRWTMDESLWPVVYGPSSVVRKKDGDEMSGTEKLGS